MLAPNVETLTLNSIAEGRISTAAVLGRTVVPFFSAAQEEKSKVTAHLAGEPSPRGFYERAAEDDTAGVWQAYRAAGVMVTPELFLADNGKQLVPDMKADGSELYGKLRRHWLTEPLDFADPNAPTKPEHPEIDELFVGLLRKKERQVRERVAAYMRAATAAGIELPYDDPAELLIRPDGSWDVLALDLRATKLGTHAKFVEGYNEKYIALFEASLGKIYKALVQQGVKPRRPGSAWWQLAR
jgi:hypothetical protein